MSRAAASPGAQQGATVSPRCPATVADVAPFPHNAGAAGAGVHLDADPRRAFEGGLRPAGVDVLHHRRLVPRLPVPHDPGQGAGARGRRRRASTPTRVGANFGRRPAGRCCSDAAAGCGSADGAAAADAGIPIQGHAGLVPRKSTWTGGLRAVGKTLDEALWVYNEIKALEEAGAYAVEVEVIPEQLLIEISQRTSLLTSSIGGGKGGDLQFLFAEDILGNNSPPYPRHSKQYRNIFKMKQEMQAERVAGFKEFIEDVQTGSFPEQKHIIQAPEGLIDKFLNEI